MRGSADRRAHRTPEVVVAVVGLALSGLVLGGVAAVVGRADEDSFARELGPALDRAGIVAAGPDAYATARTLATWFGVTFLVVLATTIVGVLAARSRPWRRVPGVWFLAAGLACLVGSRFALYPVAFLFLAAAALFVVRDVPVPPDRRRPPPSRRGRASAAPSRGTPDPSTTGGPR